MAYYLTYDERYYGGYISGVAGSRDAPSSTSTSFTLAPNSIGYGLFIPSAYYQADLDIYDLGILDAGTYRLDVDGYNWDFGNTYFGTGIAEFGVFDYSQIAASGNYSYNDFSDVEFTLQSPSQMYAYVWGSPFSETEYSIEYTKIADPIVPISNLPTIFDNATYTIVNGDGDSLLEIGETVNFSIDKFDVDGIYLTEISWYNDLAQDTPIYTGDTYTVSQSDAGKTLYAQAFVLDNLGNITPSSKYSILQVQNPIVTYSVTDPTDIDTNNNEISENASSNSVVGITAYAEDLNAGDSVSYT